jgi:hypothetical protein
MNAQISQSENLPSQKRVPFQEMRNIENLKSSKKCLSTDLNKSIRKKGRGKTKESPSKIVSKKGGKQVEDL